MASHDLPLDPVDLFQQADLAGIIDQLWAAGRAAGSGSREASDQLLRVITEIRRLENWAATVPRLRPTLMLTNGMADTIAELHRCADSVLKALEAETFADAQAAAPEIQVALDSIALRVSKFGDAVREFQHIRDAEDPIGALIGLAFREDLYSIEEGGAAILKSRLDTESSTAASLTALIGDATASVIWNPEAYWETASIHLQFLRSHGGSVGATMRLPEFEQRMAEVAHDSIHAARAAARTPEALTDRAQLTELLEAAHLLVEQSIKLHLGVVASLVTKMSFSDTQLADVSELVNVAREKGWSLASRVPPAVIRNAFAHRRYALDGHDVVFQGPKSKPSETRISLTGLQDIVLNAAETAAAMELAVVITGSDAGVEIQPDIPAVWMAEASMAGLGWSKVSVRIVDRVAAIEATLTEGCTMSTLSFAIAPLSTVADRIEALLHGPNGSVHLTTPLDVQEAWANIMDPTEKTARFVELLRLTLSDGTPVVEEEVAVKALAFLAAEKAVDREIMDSEVLANLRSIRAVSRDLGFDRLTRILGRTIYWRTMRDSDTPVAPDEIRDLFDLAAADVKPMTEMLLT